MQKHVHTKSYMYTKIYIHINIQNIDPYIYI